MVKAVIDIKEETNRILNIIKAKYGLKDKSSAIDKLCEEYAKEILEESLTVGEEHSSESESKSEKGRNKPKVHYVG